MKTANCTLAGICLIALASCGGGGGGGSSGTPAPSPPPTLAVTLSSTSANVVVDEGKAVNFGFDATYSGTASTPVVPDVRFASGQFELASSPTLAGNTVSVRLKNVPFLPAQSGQTIVTFRLCTTADCTTVYPGSTQTFAVGYDINLDPWTQFQRNARHTGYVAVRYDPARFQRAWEVLDGVKGGRVRPAAAIEGTVYTVLGRNGGSAYNGTTRLIAINSGTGALRGTFELGDQFHASGPSLSPNGLYVATTALSGTDAIWVINRDNLSFRNLLPMAVQFVDFEQPAVEEDRVYFSGGDTGGVTWAFDGALGTTLWRTLSGSAGNWGGQVLSYDETSVYNYRGPVLEILNKSTGAVMDTIADPGSNTAVDYYGAPVLDGEGRLILFSGNKRFLGSNQIIAMSLSSKSILWRTVAAYSTAFAVRKNVIYAVRQDARVLSAISAQDGSVLWSTRLPATPDEFGQDVLAGNVIVTENLAFVSSASKTWAIDIESADHPIVWEGDTGGRLTLTPDNLLVTTNMPFNAKVTAYRLN